MGRKKDNIPVGAIGCLIVLMFILSPFIYIGKFITGDTSDSAVLQNAAVGILVVVGIAVFIYILIQLVKKLSLQSQADSNRRELEEFIQNGGHLEPLTVDIFLGANEQAYYNENHVVLGQAKNVHKRDGAGVGFRVFRGVGVGSYHSEGRTYNELRGCDKGSLILTNRNLIFRGIAEQRIISLNNILYVEEFIDAIQISQRNKKSMDYFFVRNPCLWGYLIRKMMCGDLPLENSHTYTTPRSRVVNVETVHTATQVPLLTAGSSGNSVDSSKPPASLHPSPNVIRFNKSQPTSTVEQVFMRGYYSLAMEIIRRSGLEAIGRKTGYVNLYCSKALAQLHPHHLGVALVIPELDQRCPHCTILQQISIQGLQGYQGTNKSWMDGDGTRWTYSPAGAFLVPGEMENQPDHPGWKEIDALIAYIKFR